MIRSYRTWMDRQWMEKKETGQDGGHVTKKVRGRVDWKAVSTKRDTFFMDNKGEAGGGIS